MHLTREEEKCLQGERGEAIATALKLLVTIGDIFEAERLIPVRSAQISGVSYKTIGDAGLEFIENFADLGAKTTVRTTTNPAGMDLERWKETGVPEDFALKQIRIISALVKMGANPTCTCTPYLLEEKPHYGDHIAWAESSAVIYANSILGARTNREGGPTALASAIAGKTPFYGAHLDENRAPTIDVDIQTQLRNELDYSLLGFLIGKESAGGIPLISLHSHMPNIVCLKALGASMATSGGQAIYHIRDLTPESHKFRDSQLHEKISVERHDLEKVKDSLSTEKQPDCVCLGCPHCSIDEIRRVSKWAEGKRLKKRLSVFTSKHVWGLAKAEGLLDSIVGAGGAIIRDTCMVVAPFEQMGISDVVINSAKAAYYLPSLCSTSVRLASLEECLEYALHGD